MQLVLENANIAARSDHPHYALVEDKLPPAIERSISNAYNIKFIKYPKGQHSEAEKALRSLADRVTKLRASQPT